MRKIILNKKWFKPIECSLLHPQINFSVALSSLGGWFDEPERYLQDVLTLRNLIIFFLPFLLYNSVIPDAEILGIMCLISLRSFALVLPFSFTCFPSERHLFILISQDVKPPEIKK